MDRDLLKAISRREWELTFRWMSHGHQAGSEFQVEKAMSDTDFVQITATTDYATGQALLYALTRAGYVWQFDFSKQRWEILPTTRA